jgi:AraC family transcriptional regulator
MTSAASFRNAMNVESVRKQLCERTVIGTSAGRPWEGISVDEYASCRADDPHFLAPRDHHVVTISLGESPYVFQERLGQRFESPCHFGEITMMPAGYEMRFRGELPAHIRIGISLASLAEAADALTRIGVPARGTISNGFCVRDPWLEHLGAVLSLELRQAPHPAQDLMIDALASALSVHLLKNYGTLTEVVDREASTGNAAAIRRALDYIEDCEARRISLDDLAAVAGLSRYHFVRVFTREVGLSPMQYLQRTRIERSKVLITTGNLSLAEVAYATGFADQSHFTRRFKLHVGCTPAAYARRTSR